MAKSETTPLIDTTAAATGAWQETGGLIASPYAYLSDGATAASVDIEVSHDKVGAVLLGNITLSSQTPSDTFSVPDTCKFGYVRAKVTSVTGGRVRALCATYDK